MRDESRTEDHRTGVPPVSPKIEKDSDMNPLLRSKGLMLVAVVAVLAFMMFLLSLVYRPRGVEAIKSQIEKSRSSLNELDKERERLRNETQALQEELARAQGTTATLGVARTNVSVKVLEPSLFQDVLVLPGIVEAKEDILLAAKEEGTVEWIGPREGQALSKGDMIMKIDADVLIPQLRSAEAAENLAQTNFKRIENLARQKVTSTEELDRARAELKEAQAATAIARKSFEDATLYSPINGIADELMPDVGEFVNRGQTVARLVDVSTVKITLSVPEKDVSYFRLGQSANVHLPEPFEGETTGTISYIATVADEESKTFRVEVSVSNSDRMFRPGMIARVDLVRREQKDAIVVSFFSVMQTQEEALTYVENDGQAEARPVKIGGRRGMTLEVTEGLKPGDRLIVEGQRMVSDGTPVRVIEVQKSGSSLTEDQP